MQHPRRGEEMDKRADQRAHDDRSYASCSEDVMESYETAFYAVFDGAPVTFDKNGNEVFHEPIYATPYFYTDE